MSADRWAFYEPLYRSALLGQTHSIEIASPDGEGWYAVEVAPLRAGDGAIVGGVSFAIGITKRKRAEAELTRLASIVAAAHYAIFSLDMDWACHELERGG